MFKRFLLFLKQWNDLLILAPSALILFVVGGKIIRYIDPTASILELGVLSILNWNIFTLLIIGTASYYLYDLWFGDYFEGEWTDNLTPISASILNIILWLSTFSIATYVILRNL